ncbi:MAG: hypothetical protein KKF37_00300 [Proteobacteria bacterium]|nr:hypothetical protein [Pseudomonadota bacterium]
MIKFVSSLFGSKECERPTNESDIRKYAENALSGLGVYATNSLSDDWPKWEKKMEEDLGYLEVQAQKFSSPHLYTQAGNGWGLFAIWYRRKKDDKTIPLRRGISLLERALGIDPDFEKAKIALGSILVERQQVRDLNRALLLLNSIQNKSGQTQELISKAKRWLGDIDFDQSFDYTNLQLLPLNALREELKKCRALIRNLIKDKNLDKMRPVLEHMYRLAVLHDAATYVVLHGDYFIDKNKDRAWDKKLQKIVNSINKFSYSSNGAIPSGEGYLSKNDNKNFQLVFGETSKVFLPAKLL